MAPFNAGDTAWVLTSAALVLFMTPGLAMFYGGLVRAKNVLSVMAGSFICMGLVGVLWATLGYTIAFGHDIGGLVGGLDFAGMRGIMTGASSLAPTIPHAAFVTYQMMFAIIAPALITGAFAERMKFKAWVLLLAGWSLLVYSPLAHWVWGGGWLGRLGVLDFAGETVIHLSSAAAAAACVIVVGKRHGFGSEDYHPHNLPMTLIGAGILWFGWCGFNGGSSLTAGQGAAGAVLCTVLAASAGMLSWLLIESFHAGKATTLGAASGAVAGLVGITPSAGYVGPMTAILIGAVVGGVCYAGVTMKSKLGYDDALDVLGIHGAGGIAGMLLTGVFASAALTPGGVGGLLSGNWRFFLVECLAIVVALGYSFIVTFGLLKAIDLTVGVRAEEDDEMRGLDVAEHAEHAYEPI